MDWKEEYQSKLMSADEAVKLVKSGERWATTHATAESMVLAEALCRRADELENVQLWQGLNWGNAPYCDPKYHGHLDVDTIFCGPATRIATSDGRGEFAPMSVSMIDRAFSEVRPVDGLLAHVTPPDEHGYCNLGVSVDFGASAIAHGKKIIAHVNKNMPWVYGNYNTIHVSQIDAIVEGESHLRCAPVDDGRCYFPADRIPLLRYAPCLDRGAGPVYVYLADLYFQRHGCQAAQPY